MTPHQSGKLGGTATRDKHISVCPLCGNPVKNRHFMEIGQKGGERAVQTAGKNDSPSMSERGRLGGRGNTREKRQGNGRLITNEMVQDATERGKKRA